MHASAEGKEEEKGADSGGEDKENDENMPL